MTVYGFINQRLPECKVVNIYKTEALEGNIRTESLRGWRVGQGCPALCVDTERRSTGWSGRQKNEVTSAVQADSAFVGDRAQGSGCAHTRVSSSPSTWMVSRKAGSDSLSIAF